jgi:hypothetical protein
MSPAELEVGIPYIANKIQDLDQCHPEDVSSYVAEIRGYAHAAGYETPSPKPTMPPTPPYARSSSGSMGIQTMSMPSTPARSASEQTLLSVKSAQQSVHQQSYPPPTAPLPNIPLSASPEKESLLRKKPRPPKIYVPSEAAKASGTKSEGGSPKLEQHAMAPPRAQEEKPLERSSTLHISTNSANASKLESPPKTALRRSLSMSDTNRPQARSVDTNRPQAGPVDKKVVPSPNKLERSSDPHRPLFGPSGWNVPVAFDSPDKRQDSPQSQTSAVIASAIEESYLPPPPELHRKSSTWSEQANFERAQFRNAVILCNV